LDAVSKMPTAAAGWQPIPFLPVAQLLTDQIYVPQTSRQRLAVNLSQVKDRLRRTTMAGDDGASTGAEV
jgi:hypothetical protein